MILFILISILVFTVVSAAPPEISDEIPTNGTTKVNDDPTLYVNISDPDGDLMNVTISTNHTDRPFEHINELYLDVGNYDSGNIASTYVVNDANVYHLSEVTGAPGFLLYFNFTSSEVPNSISIYTLYDGNAGHLVNVDVYNFSSAGWTTLGQIVDGVSYSWVNFSIPDTSNHTHFLETRIRIDHTSSGNKNHDLFIDYIGLNDTWYTLGYAVSQSNSTYSTVFCLEVDPYVIFYWSVYLEDGTNENWTIFNFEGGFASSPEIVEYPINNTIDVRLTPAIGCLFNCSLLPGVQVNVTFWENSSGSWVIVQRYITITNGTFWFFYENASNYNTKYYWNMTIERLGENCLVGPFNFQTETEVTITTEDLTNAELIITGVTGALSVLIILIGLAIVMAQMRRTCE